MWALMGPVASVQEPCEHWEPGPHRQPCEEQDQDPLEPPHSGPSPCIAHTKQLARHLRAGDAWRILAKARASRPEVASRLRASLLSREICRLPLSEDRGHRRLQGRAGHGASGHGQEHGGSGSSGDAERVRWGVGASRLDSASTGSRETSQDQPRTRKRRSTPALPSATMYMDWRRFGGSARVAVDSGGAGEQRPAKEAPPVYNGPPFSYHVHGLAKDCTLSQT